MAYETKVILIALADTAARTKAKDIYRLIVKMANVDGIDLKSYEDAVAEIEEQEKTNT